jgi:prevent-host-death family protein
MEVSIAEAKARFAELVRRAEDGDEVVVTRHGHPAAKLSAANPRIQPDWDEVRRRVKEIQTRVKAMEHPEMADAARSQDWLYDDYGVPR